MHLRWVLSLFGIAASALAPTLAVGMSVSLADVFFPTYGSAVHWSQDNEYLGLDGESYDGVDFAIENDLLQLDLRPRVGDLFDEGDYEWLSVWIDWDLSRTWDQSERVVYEPDAWFEHGTSLRQYVLPVPDGVDLSEVWMRVRFTFDGPHGPSGELLTGEVEDYRLGEPTPPIPEPSVVSLVLMGLAAIAGQRIVRSRRR